MNDFIPALIILISVAVGFIMGLFTQSDGINIHCNIDRSMNKNHQPTAEDEDRIP